MVQLTSSGAEEPRSWQTETGSKQAAQELLTWAAAAPK